MGTSVLYVKNCLSCGQVYSMWTSVLYVHGQVYAMWTNLHANKCPLCGKVHSMQAIELYPDSCILYRNLYSKARFPYNRSRRYCRYSHEQNGVTGAFLRFPYNRYYRSRRYCRERHGFHIIATVTE